MKKRITTALLLTTALVAFVAPVGSQTIRNRAPEAEAAAPAAGRGRAFTLFGMIGLARGQSARLNVVNLRTVPAPDPTIDDASLVTTPVPCHVRLRFLDQRGNTIARSTESILPGDGAFLDLSFQDAVPPGFEGKRFEIRAIVQVLTRPELTRRCATISTLEIFDNETGRTNVIYPEPPR